MQSPDPLWSLGSFNGGILYTLAQHVGTVSSSFNVPGLSKLKQDEVLRTDAHCLFGAVRQR